MIGRVELAVSTDLMIRFLATPGRVDLVAQGRIMKLGRELAIGEVDARCEGQDQLVAHVSGTYAIPPGSLA
jgi:acyl-coenzyme A thioesterase PaaI-like protein